MTFVVWIATLLCAGTLSGTAYYVAPNGNDANAGTVGQPFRTYVPAYNAARAGDVIYFRQGLYDYFSPPGSEFYMRIDNRGGSPGNHVTYASYPGETAAIDVGTANKGVATQKWQRFERLRIFSSSPGGNRQGVAMFDSDGNTFERCEFEGVGSGVGGENPSAIFSGLTVGVAQGISVRNCTFHNLPGNTLAIEMYNVHDALFENNEVGPGPGGSVYDKALGYRNHFRRNYVHDVDHAAFRGNSAPDPSVSNATYENIVAHCGYGLGNDGHNHQEYDAVFFNNAVYDTMDAAGFGNGGDNHRFWNNILHTASEYVFVSRGTHTTDGGLPTYWDHNCIVAPGVDFRANRWATGDVTYTDYDAWRAATGLDAHSTTANPMFVSLAGGDFHLQVGSPCIHTGTNYLGLSPGYAGGPPDMGAYPRGNEGTVIGVLPTGTPAIHITTPTGTGTYTTSSSTITIGGTSSDSDGNVTSIAWTNTANGGHGTLTSGLANWSVPTIALALGANVIRVTAYDNDGNIAVDAITVTYQIAAPDTTPPYVAQASPASGATGVAVGANISFHVLDAGTGVNQSTLVLTVGGQTVTPTITGTSADLTVFYNPPSDFAAGATATVAVDVYDLATTPNRLQTSWQFRCVTPGAPDTAPPAVSQQIPAPGATQVARNAVIRFHLSDAQTGVNQSTVVLRVDGVVVTPAFSGTPQDLDVLYDPPTDFASLATVTVSVDASDGASPANAMATVSWSFTCSQVVIEPPSPPSNLVAYPSSNVISLQFSPSAGANVAGYYLYYRNGTAGYVRVNLGSGTSYFLTDLEPGTTYHLSVTAYDVADQESDPTAEIAVTTLSGGNGGEEPAVVEDLEVRPNRASLSSGETVEIIGPPSLAERSVGIYTLAGTLSREVTLRGDATQTLNPAADLGGAEGLYIIVAEGRRPARLLVAP
jgi:hypothetical protein